MDAACRPVFLRQGLPLDASPQHEKDCRQYLLRRQGLPPAAGFALVGSSFVPLPFWDERLRYFPHLVCQFPGFYPCPFISFHTFFIGFSLFPDKL
jgi:hypothetical protein